MIKLYRGPLSTNVERVALALAHKGLEVESIEIDWDDRSPVEAVSGQSLVPVIQDDGGDGEVVYDSATILRYLEERYPEPPLFPSDPARRAEMDVFIDWFNEVWKYSPNTIEEELEKGSPDAAVIERHSALMVERMGLFERLLDGRDYLMGDEVIRRRFRRLPLPQVRAVPEAAGGRRALPPGAGRPTSLWATTIPASGPGSSASTRCRGPSLKRMRPLAAITIAAVAIAAPGCGGDDDRRKRRFRAGPIPMRRG